MDLRQLSDRIKNLIIDPAKAWETIVSENRPVREETLGYLYPLIIPGTVAAFLGPFLFSHSDLHPMFFILAGIKYFLLMIISVYATSFIFNETAKRIGIKCDYRSSFYLVIYSLAPLLLCQIVSRLFESFIFVNVLSLYGLYIFWTGTEKLFNPPDEKKVTMLISVTVIVIATFFTANWFLTKVIDRLYLAMFA
jgi:hypothetical protein